MAAPTATEITFQVLVALGVLSQGNNTLMNYSDLATTAAQALKSAVTLPMAAADQSVDLAELFPGLTAGSTRMFYILEVTTGTRNGFTVKTEAAGVGVAVRADNTGPGGLYLVTSDSLPEFFIDNGSALAETYLSIGVLGS